MRQLLKKGCYVSHLYAFSEPEKCQKLNRNSPKKLCNPNKLSQRRNPCSVYYHHYRKLLPITMDYV